MGIDAQDMLEELCEGYLTPFTPTRSPDGWTAEVEIGAWDKRWKVTVEQLEDEDAGSAVDGASAAAGGGAADREPGDGREPGDEGDPGRGGSGDDDLRGADHGPTDNGRDPDVASDHSSAAFQFDGERIHVNWEAFQARSGGRQVRDD